MSDSAICIASPSLALIKYWGKEDEGTNVPATGSLAVTLGGLETRTVVEVSEEGADRVIIDGCLQPPQRFAPFFDNLRDFLCRNVAFSETLKCPGNPSRLRFSARSTNSFPTAAGIASSSSGFAALAGACAAAAGIEPPAEELSALARVGSGSAARSIFGGYVHFPAGARFAEPVRPPDWIPGLRMAVAIVRSESKEHASRDAMEHSKATSPYYHEWIRTSPADLSRALDALEARDIEELGEAMRRSYLRMFGTIFSADPPINYWLPDSVAIIRACEELRSRGFAAWETMDAGPQVKILTLESDLRHVHQSLLAAVPGVLIIDSAPGAGLRFPEGAADEADGPR